MDTQNDSSIVCNNYGQQKITTLRMWYCCTKLPKDFPFLSSYSLARIHPDMTICPQNKTQKNTKYNTVIQTVLMRLSLERIRFTLFRPNIADALTHANLIGCWCVSPLRHRQAGCGAAPGWCVRQRFLTLVINTIGMWQVEKNADMIRCHSRLNRYLHGTWFKNNMVCWVWVGIIAKEIRSQSRVWLA